MEARRAVIIESAESAADLLLSLPAVVGSCNMTNVLNMLPSMILLLVLVTILSALSAAYVGAFSILPWTDVHFLVAATPVIWSVVCVLFWGLCLASIRIQVVTVGSLRTAFSENCCPACVLLSLAAAVYMIFLLAAGVNLAASWRVPIVWGAVLQLALCVSIVAWSRYRRESSAEFRARWEAKCRKAARLDRPQPKRAPLWKSVIVSSVPLVVTWAVAALICFGILPLHGLVNSSIYRSAVYLFSAVFVKGAGSKLIARALVPWIESNPSVVDCQLFFYELLISLLARLMLLREPDGVALLAAGISSGLFELFVRVRRVWILNRVDACLRQQLGEAQDMLLLPDRPIIEIEQEIALCKAALAKYLQRRALGSSAVVANATVEYLGANIAMMLTVFFERAGNCLQFGTFHLTVDRICLALVAQHGPELVTDAMAMTFELSAGLDLFASLQLQFSRGSLCFKAVICLFVVFLVVQAQLFTTAGGEQNSAVCL